MVTAARFAGYGSDENQQVVDILRAVADRHRANFESVKNNWSRLTQTLTEICWPRCARRLTMCVRTSRTF
jgi:hypothetical protein